MEAQTTPGSQDVVFKFLGWLHANRKPVIGAVVALAVIGTVAGLYSWKQGENDADANSRLLALPVGPDLRVHAGDHQLSELASQYSSTPSGEYASLLAAEDLFINNKYPEAEHAFSTFLTDHPASDLAGQAGVGVAASLEAQGKTPEAIQQYEKVIQASPTDLSVIEPAKLTLGRLFEQQGKFTEAFSQYRELAQNPNPNDLWAGESKERLQLLVGKHPELMKQIISSAASSAMAPAGAMSSSGSNGAIHLMQPSTKP